MSHVPCHPRESCHPERSEGPMHFFLERHKYMGPSRKERAQDDRENPRESAEKKLPRSSG